VYLYYEQENICIINTKFSAPIAPKIINSTKPYSVVINFHIYTKDVTLYYIKNVHCTFFRTFTAKTFHTELQRNKTNLLHIIVQQVGFVPL
jgi:hypothetical protein